MHADTLRAKGDRDRFAALSKRADVQATLASAARIEREHGARRHLLGTALRLTPSMAPDLLATVDACRATLGIVASVEVYVYPSADFNAAAVTPEGDHLLVLLSSSLLEAFEPDELRYVVGHELGHLAFEHHALPIATLLDPKAGPAADLALELYAWQRYAEISADRAGLACAGALDPVASGLFKLASGLRGARIAIDIPAFLRQLGDLRTETTRLATAKEGPQRDWFSTHPFSPLRLRAAQLFANSERIRPGGTPVAQLEASVEELMRVMSPSYLSEKSDVAEQMRRLLLAGAILVAHASGGIHATERAALERLLGRDGVPTTLDPALFEADLERRVDGVRALVPELRRGQIIRDLVLVARAHGRVSRAELRVIEDLARRIGVPETVIEQSCRQTTDLD